MLRLRFSLKGIFSSPIAVRLETGINSGMFFGLCYVEKEENRINNHSVAFCLKMCIIVSLNREEKMQKICGKDSSVK